MSMFCQTLSVSQTLDDYLQKSIRMSNHTKKRAFYKKKKDLYILDFVLQDQEDILQLKLYAMKMLQNQKKKKKRFLISIVLIFTNQRETE